MINSRGKDVEAKQEAGAGDISVKLCRQPATAAGTSSSSSRQWSAFRNPRIVRVSRTFGGKDRHSKVCTVRGLRDRRIRLSVPTAIQLYDLQDRLGLTQPSKVIDWLIDATKDDIDKLPPLQLPPGFAQFHQPMLPSQFDHLGSGSAQAQLAGPFFDHTNPTFMKDIGFHSFGTDHSCLRSRNHKEVDESTMEKGKWIKTNDQEGVCNNNNNNNNDHYNNIGSQVSAQNFFPLATTTNPSSSIPNSFLNNNNSNLPFNPYFHWDASNLSLSQFGTQGFVSQPENNSVLTTPTSQLFFCPPATIPSFFQPFPPHVTSTPVEISTNHFMSSSRTIMSTPMKHFSLNVNQSHPNDQKDN